MPLIEQLIDRFFGRLREGDGGEEEEEVFHNEWFSVAGCRLSVASCWLLVVGCFDIGKVQKKVGVL